MEWYEPLYVSDSMKKKKNRILWRLNHNAGILNGFLVTLAINEVNLLEIYPMREMKWNHYLRKNLTVVGITKTYEEAVEMVTAIVDMTYQSLHSSDVRTFLKENRG